MLNSFLSEFKDKCDSCFINNFQLVKKNFNEEMEIFDYSQLHYHNLERLLLQGKASLDQKSIDYAYKYLNIIQNMEIDKIDSMLKYFIENFHEIKEEHPSWKKQDKGSTTTEEVHELTWEWENPKKTNKLAIFSNHHTQLRGVATKFEKMKFIMREINKQHIISHLSILRFYWSTYDIREYYSKDTFSPYINVGGSFYIKALIFPNEPYEKNTWFIRNQIGEEYKNPTYLPNPPKLGKMRMAISLPPNIFTEDICKEGNTVINVKVGMYNENEHEWSFDSMETTDLTNDEKCPGAKIIDFCVEYLGIYGVLIQRKINFPYTYWNLRCIKKNDVTVAIIDLKSKFLLIV